jgi:hypothetical protein
MSYRDDRDADQARIAALETELAAAKKRIDELEGNRSQALVLAGGGALATAGASQPAAQKWLGAPTELGFSRTFGAEFPKDRFEDLVDAIREITGDRGTTELMRSSVSWSSSTSEKSIGPFINVVVTVKNGVTKLEVRDRLGQLAGGIFGGVGGGVGGTAIIAPIAATVAMPLLAPVAFAAWLGGTYWGCRALYKRSAKKRAMRLQAVFDKVLAAVEHEMQTATPVQQALAADTPELDRVRDRDKTAE